MSISVTFNSAHRIQLASAFFMARRPVVDRQQNLVAHELLFCNIVPDGAIQSNDGEDQPTSSSVIADVYQHGMGRVIGDLVGILHIDTGALMSDVFQFLPPEKLVLEISDLVGVTPEALERVRELTAAGFRFALVINHETRDVHALIPLVEGARIDITCKDEAWLRGYCDTFKAHGKKLLAERVDSHEQFKTCFDLGFDFFQGYYFLQPQITHARKLSPSQLAITQLMALVSTDADNDLIERSIKGDVSLGLNLLRLVNTPAFSVHRIDSLRQALMVLGRNQLERWLQIMLYAGPGGQERPMMALLAQATTRGRMMELLAQKLRPGNRSIADTGFTVGIMSLMDTLFGMPMEEILRQIPVVDEVGDALVRREGYYGKLLEVVEYVEWHAQADTLLLQQAIEALRLSYNDLYLLQLAAFEWSDQVTSGMR